MELDHPASNREPQPAALDLLGAALDPLEASKDPGLLLERNAWPVVGDTQADLFSGASQADTDQATLAAILVGVAQQIGQYPLQASAIGVHLQPVGRQVDFESLATGLGQWLDRPRGAPRQ